MVRMFALQLGYDDMLTLHYGINSVTLPPFVWDRWPLTAFATWRVDVTYTGVLNAEI